MAVEKLFITTANQTQAFLGQVTAETRAIRDAALYKAHLQDHVDIVEQGSISYASLSDFMRSADWQTVTMLHYIGHSSGQGIGVEGVGQQAPSVIDQEALESLFSRSNALRLVFLNSCCSQAIAQTLLQLGVPYVIGTNAKIKDNQAVLVAQKFYEILGDVYNSATIEQAFDQTLIYFKNDPQNPSLQAAFQQVASRGAFDTSVDEPDSPAFSWQLYRKETLTEAQRDWRLIPPKVIQPTEYNERYIVTPPATVGRPFSFFLSYTPVDKDVAGELVEQIRQSFQYHAPVDRIWTDETLTDPATVPSRNQQLIDQLQQADFVFMLVNKAYLANPVGRRVMDMAQAQRESDNLKFRPIVFPTARCPLQNSGAKEIDYFPFDGKLFTTENAETFGIEFYERWKRWRKDQLKPISQDVEAGK